MHHTLADASDNIVDKTACDISSTQKLPGLEGPGSKPDVMSGTLTGASTHPSENGVDLSYL